MLEMKNVYKNYGTYQVLKHVDLCLDEGIYALLGPNGSGKSTLMKLICRQLKPTKGQILWKHKKIDDWGQHYFIDIGYAPQQQGLYEDMTGLQFLTYMALLKGIEKKKLKSEVNRVAQLVNMEKFLKQKCKTYSGGMKQRILVAQALFNNPSLLLLDEHTAALDPQTASKVLELTDKIVKKNQMTTLMITHNMQDALTYGQKIMIMKEGQIIDVINSERKKDLTVEQLIHLYSSKTNDYNDRILL